MRQSLRRYVLLLTLYALFSLLYAGVEGLSLSILPIILRVLVGSTAEATLVPALKPIERFLEGYILLQDKYEALRNLSFFVAGIFLAKMVVNSVKKFSILALMESVARDLRERVFASVMRASISSLRDMRVGDLVSRLTGEIQYIKLAVRDGIGALLGEGFNLAVFATLALTSAPVLSAFAWGILVVASLLGWAVSRVVKRRANKALRSLGDLSAYLSKSLEGVKVIKSLNAVNTAIRRFLEHSHRLYVQFVKLEFSAALAPIFSETLVGLSAALILFLAGYFIFKARLVQPDAFIVFLAASLSMIRPLKLIFQSLAYINTARSSYERLRYLMELPQERWGDRDPTNWRTLELRDVEVSVGDKVILRVPHLRILRGERVAVIGRSGAGKSTLLDLLAGFVRPSRGEVLLDGVSLYEYDLTRWRNVVGYVPQETYIFDGTLRENLFGTPWEWLDRLHLDHLAGRMDEPIVNLKDALSGGEKQRIGILRVLARRPSLLLMDEPTSALDSRSEAALKDLLESFPDITLVVAAHKRSTALWGKRVVVIEGGEVVCDGSHESLAVSCPQYSSLMDDFS
ncbi:MAG: ABC transporter ATP-binding protein [Thermotogae bacterium]|nr:ABC transporter ATP-binding protein [Thermotogota bacterium]